MGGRRDKFPSRTVRFQSGATTITILGGIMSDRISEQDARDAFSAYLDAALWTGFVYVNEDDENPEPLDSLATVDDIPADEREELLEDWLTFVGGNYAALLEFMAVTGRGLSDAAHDFHLTRNHHGAGFWDRGAGAVGERLTAASDRYGTAELVGYYDEGSLRIYVSN